MNSRQVWARGGVFRPEPEFIIWRKLPDGSVADALLFGAGRMGAAGGGFILFI
ncbi:hypothetical protein [Paenibacillus sp. 843]|uniref:hypothetical protein n=1 Tax=Paenibacillus sp. 843 TaxID=3341795 RepID=UPI00372CE7E1